MKRKFLSALLVLALTLTLLPATALAWDVDDVAYPVTGGNIYFDPDTGTVTGVDRDVTAADIPAQINGVAVTGIGDWAFSLGGDNLVSVTIPEGVTRIGETAFYMCSNLANLTIPDSVTSIGSMAFYCCNSLTSVDISANVTSIEREAFERCKSLKSINVAADNPNYISKDGVLFNKEQTELLAYPAGKVGAYVIPDSITSLKDSLFCDCAGLTDITIPSSITSIGNSVFKECGLTSVTIPDSVTSIGSSAFYGCKNLTSVTIPDSVTSIENGAFADCSSLTSVTIPSSVTSLVDNAFIGCTSLTSVTIPASVTSIGYDAFGECPQLTDVYYGGSEAQWKAISLFKYDGMLGDSVPTTDLADVGLGKATIHYNSTGAEVQPPVAGFTDVKAGDWYAEAVQFAVDNGLMNGTGNGKFSPNGTTTRGQLMTILARLDGQDTTGGSIWYEKGMAWAKSKGISDGTNPTGVITREQLAAMLYRYAGSPAVSASLSQYPDAGKVSGYAVDAMAWAVKQGIINGVSGNLAPQGTATRAQASTMIMRFYEKK